MSNIIVTSDSIKIDVAFNDMSTIAQMNKATFKRTNINLVETNSDEDCVTVVMIDGMKFDLSHNGTQGTLTVDTINGQTPTGVDDLHNKITALML